MSAMTPWAIRVFVALAALSCGILLFWGGSRTSTHEMPAPHVPPVAPAPWTPPSGDSVSDRQAASSIVLENYMPSYAMLNSGLDAVNYGRWTALYEGTTARCSGNCWYVEYDFPAVDPQEPAREAKCEWIVDLTRHIATPANEQASYYWMSKK